MPRVAGRIPWGDSQLVAFPAASGLAADTARGNKVAEDKRLRIVGEEVVAGVAVAGAWVAPGLAVVAPAVAVVVRHFVVVATVGFVESSRLAYSENNLLSK